MNMEILSWGVILGGAIFAIIRGSRKNCKWCGKVYRKNDSTASNRDRYCSAKCQMEFKRSEGNINSHKDCKKCINRKISNELGLLCFLTGEKPIYPNDCLDFKEE